MPEPNVCLQLLLAWLERAHGRRFTVDEQSEIAPAGLSALASEGSARLAVEVHQLLGPAENPVWTAQREHLQDQIAVGLPGAFAVWIPAGADLPAGAAETMEFLQLVREKALTLRPGERSFVPFPIAIYLKKVGDEGSLVSVVGGLSPHWARLSEAVRGQFDLDSTRLHRLPEPEEHLPQLMQTIWQRAKEIERPGQWVDIETVDAWTIQRLPGEHGVTILGIPPEELGDVGLAVRRNFRRVLADAAPRLRQRDAELRALVVLGCYPRLEQEGATTALRGYDPALYANVDFICLATDGLLKPLIQPPAHLLPWARS
ncbi:MAG: hypothetical protein HYY03_03180 [Chloroflexi bacterium]|nr:hypothetical protein [Chloroflexota bacterium]